MGLIDCCVNDQLNLKMTLRVSVFSSGEENPFILADVCVQIDNLQQMSFYC